MRKIKYLYHKIMAAQLNWRAARHSRLLLKVGGRSNAHERKRDALK